MRGSMSRKADCRDNAPTESLRDSMKRAGLHGKRFQMRRAGQADGVLQRYESERMIHNVRV